jgi:hypothetical protein
MRAAGWLRPAREVWFGATLDGGETRERIRLETSTVSSEALCRKTTQPRKRLTAKWDRSTSTGDTAEGQ